MPVYNGEKYLRLAIESILRQTESDFEFIIIDDGSTDGTENIITSFSDSRIRYVKTNHGGIVVALNTGISKSSGVYVARMDADDVSLPKRFEIQCHYLDQHQDVAVCGTWADEVNEHGDVVGEMNFPPTEINVKDLFLHNPFIHSSVMIRRDTLISVGFYKKSFRHAEDYELWSRLLASHKGVNISEKLLQYRKHENQITVTKKFSTRYKGVAVRILVLYRKVFKQI